MTAQRTGVQPGVTATTFVPSPTISGRPGARARTEGPVFLLDAFRPFYLGGAACAALGVPLWVGMWHSGLFAPALPPMFWHAHEMVFGFAAAIIIGFLMTAARNWTGLPLPAGVPLALLAVLWLAGRAAMYFAYGVPTAVLDSLLLVIVAGVLARKFIRARSWCSMPLVVVLSLLATANITFHAALRWSLPISPLQAIEAGLFLVVLIEMIVGGRVVPGFSANALPRARQWRPAWLHRGSFTLAAGAFAADLFHLPPPLTGVLALVAGAAVAVQALGWNPLAARVNPMLWVLHAAYAWIPIGLLLLGLASLGVVPRSAAIHALAVGSMAGLIVGMITRTALGHSGRKVRAGRAEGVMFVLILLAAALRVMAALLPAAYVPGMFAAAAAWSAAFLLYLFAYAPMLLGMRPLRHDAAAPL